MEPQDLEPPNVRDVNDILTADTMERLVNPLCVVRGYTQLLQRRLRRGEVIGNNEFLRVLDLIDVASRSVTANISALAETDDSGSKDQDSE